MKPGTCPAPALTPVTGMLAELVRRYWILGMECSVLEVQNLAWFLERAAERKNRLFDDRAIGIALDRLAPDAGRP